MHRHLLRRGPAALTSTLQTHARYVMGSRSKAMSSQSEAEKASTADARGRTGGGKPLAASDHPPPQPKILNAQVPGGEGGLTAEQQREVDEHNKEFEQKHDRASQAPDDRVDKKFWSNAGNASK
ncbi:hypothetical protein GQ53DRAFT_744434 [Thozetella sp. PMI_491]|nr:hypothetical protein GQ53DRAFT_744434 [Thozetella sp. PMI_491]